MTKRILAGLLMWVCLVPYSYFLSWFVETSEGRQNWVNGPTIIWLIILGMILAIGGTALQEVKSETRDDAEHAENE